MVFKKITDNLEYSDAIKYDGTVVVGELLRDIKTLLGKNLEKIDYLHFLFDNNKDPEYIAKTIKETYQNLYLMQHKTRKLGEMCGEVREDEFADIDALDIQFYEYEDRLKIVFPSLLPKRINYASENNLLRYNEIKAMYVPAFDKFSKERKFKGFKDKVLIRYTHFYESEREIRDYDNYETKIITDLITPLAIVDDSPKECMIMSAYKVGDKSHTEADVIPVTGKIASALNEIFS